MMTILVDARPLADPAKGGVPRVAAGLLPALMAAMPGDRFVFATTGLRRPNHELPKSGEWRHFRISNKVWAGLCLLRLTSFDRLASRENPDLLFLPNLEFVGRPRIPYMLLVHDISFLIEPRWFSWKSRVWHWGVDARRLIREARHLFAVSERTKQDLIERLSIPADRVTVIPMGLDEPPSPAPLPEPLMGRRYVLALGARDKRKNAGCAIAAVDALRQDPRFSDVQLVLVGRDFGHPSDEALASLMQHASAFLYPSWYEGFGLPLHEAARFGTPCIASTAGVLPETAPQGTLFAPPSKPHLWAEALREVLDAPERNQTRTSLGDWSAGAQTIRDKLENALK